MYSSYKTNVIRRSDVIGDESLEESWRNFRANNYKVIHSSKGGITNLLGVGNIFLIHCEHTLLAIDRNQMLKTNDKDVQGKMPDTFEVDPIDMMTSYHGYGGLQIINAWTLNHAGYFFVDSDNSKIFNYDNGKIFDLTEPIRKAIEYRKIVKAAFITDIKHDRVFMCIYYADLINANNNNVKALTLSYSISRKKFISIHDFIFTERLETKTNCYFYSFDTDIQLNNTLQLRVGAPVVNTALPDLYVQAKKEICCDYGNLAYQNNEYPSGFRNIEDEATAGTKKAFYSYVDVIFNLDYEHIQVLNSIRYILSKPDDEHEKLPEEVLDKEYNRNGICLYEPNVLNSPLLNTLFSLKKYAGNILRIYTDKTDSNYLDIDISNDDNVNKDYDAGDGEVSNAYQYPYYDKGVWNLNYFRNILGGGNYERNETVRNAVKNMILAKEGMTEQEVIDSGKSDLLEGMVNSFLSDKLSLIYGRYFIIRFIFATDTPIKFENLTINTSPY